MIRLKADKKYAGKEIPARMILIYKIGDIKILRLSGGDGAVGCGMGGKAGFQASAAFS